MKIQGFDVKKMDLAIGLMWVFMGFYSIFSGAWAFAILAVAFILNLIASVLQDNTIKLQRQIIWSLAEEIAKREGKDSITITGGPDGVEEVK